MSIRQRAARVVEEGAVAMSRGLSQRGMMGRHVEARRTMGVDAGWFLAGNMKMAMGPAGAGMVLWRRPARDREYARLHGPAKGGLALGSKMGILSRPEWE